jgi:hypothetical protein
LSSASRALDPVTRKRGVRVDCVDGQAEAVALVADRQLERRVDIALLPVAAHVDVLLMRPMVGQPVDQPRVGMEVEDEPACPAPFVQCSIAASMSKYWRWTCLSAMMTLA